MVIISGKRGKTAGKAGGKKGQSANEAMLLITLLTFFLIATLAAVSDDLIRASDDNYRALLQDMADFVEQEAKIAFASENGYFHAFTLPPTLDGQPYAISIVNSSSIGDQANTTILSVASTRPNVPLNVTRLLPRDVLGTLVIGPNTVRKEQGIVVLMALPLPPLLVSAVSPPSGPIDGGTSVTITGSDFVDTPTVTFGGVAAASVTFVSSTSLTAVTPAHAAGAVDVAVTNQGGQSGTFVNGFTYVPPPAVSSFSPGIGPFSGGTTVTITGSNFVATPTVAFGGVASPSVTFVSSTSLTAVTPASAVGYVTVTVTNPDGQSGSASSQYLYRISPVAIGTVFLSSLSYNGNLEGLSGADSKCQARADAGGFGGTWKAWLSTNTVNAKTRIPDTTYRRLDNMLVANSLADLTDSSIANQISVADDGGSVVGELPVWTGTIAAGTYSGNSCNDWTSSSSSYSTLTGYTAYIDWRWTQAMVVSCSGGGVRLYCFRTS